MRTAIKIAAVIAVIGVFAVVALAGSALAYGGNTNAGTSQGMMGNHVTGMMGGQGYGHMSGQGCMNGQGYQGNACPMYVNGTTAHAASSTPATQTHCYGCW